MEGGDYREIVGAAASGGQSLRCGGRQRAAKLWASTMASSTTRSVNARAFRQAATERDSLRAFDAATNTIVIGREDELLSDELVGDEVNLIRPERFASDGVPVRAMIRYRATPTAAVATSLPMAGFAALRRAAARRLAGSTGRAARPDERRSPRRRHDRSRILTSLALRASLRTALPQALRIWTPRIDILGATKRNVSPWVWDISRGRRGFQR